VVRSRRGIAARSRQGGAARGCRGHRALVAVGLVATIPERQASEESPVSEARVDTDSWYVLVNRQSGKAASDHDRDISEGAKVTQWTRDDGSWQH
jgi:hypothetical protein